MLAFRQQSPPLPVHAPAASDTMSLAILPSAAPMACGQLPVPALLPPSPAPSKRPRLSLNTTSIPSTLYGKGSTSLRLETLSATSPTIRNTFSNAHDRLNAQSRPLARSSKPALAPLATGSTTSSQQSPESTTQNSASTISSTSSSSAVSTGEIFAAPERIPYKVSYNVTSILSNSPLPRRRTRRMSLTQSKPMFPATKQVSFRTPLTEDIKTSTYTMKHSDIESSTSTISTLELSPTKKTATSNETTDTSDDDAEKKDESSESSSSPQTGDKRQSSDEEDSDTCPATPVAGRKKRHRQWVWTLGPVATSKDQDSAEVTIRNDEKLDESS
ncbi:hypothetical protein CLAFUW4_00554 [Fulvia fulva]|uniref:Uncharacterized protein n=1 Tax=Passalora fulva TaxID=5499 RepID=A0A9Q8L5T9_PASFU|nr:uncharacterized protein CLAFUR5_00554 [Fulvia fulva]KAK4635780.1 hypothetical protein CLAFUR4_00555 [Fulvia fulva]KAK4638636.1 hypothetical protein CLAFUR0_00556 [Fulvia fulva]UJO11337.1 hypothetical protein CLAFUR5_00554 [Fulvia fulva]WPV08175.1 hypothetical protein CLAFUW4_00554 [Fulvia fulva]WPV23580.1 hypothetical protein CLAFUW7_00559 [Fulvia fulva]